MSTPADFTSIIDWWQNLHKEHVDIPKVAGPPTWKYLHTLANLTPPDAGSQDAAFKTLKQVISTFPCSTCSEHGLEYISSHPFDGNLEQYLCDFHNAVNMNLGKPLHSCDANVLSQVPMTVVEGRVEGTDVKNDEEIDYEAVPYGSQDIGISIPLGPMPGAPSIDFAVGVDEPFSILPIPVKLINWLGDPWRQERPPTPKELMMENK